MEIFTGAFASRTPNSVPQNARHAWPELKLSAWKAPKSTPAEKTVPAEKATLGVTDARRGVAEIPIEIWVPGETMTTPDTLVHRSGELTSTDPTVLQAYKSARAVLDYAQSEFGRSGFDNRGTAMKLLVKAPDPVTGEKQANNAFWFDDEQRIWLGDGDGITFSPLGGAADIVAHEFFHGVIDSEVKLAYTGQQGALHESFSDVLATGVDGNFKIGEDAYTPHVPGDALRDLANLRYKKLSDLPAYESEVHALSEVPSHAAYLVSEKLGAKEMRKIWYTALTNHMKDGSGFAGAYDATIAATTALYGAGSDATQAVRDAWAAVAIDSNTPHDVKTTKRR